MEHDSTTHRLLVPGLHKVRISTKYLTYEEFPRQFRSKVTSVHDKRRVASLTVWAHRISTSFLSGWVGKVANIPRRLLHWASIVVIERMKPLSSFNSRTKHLLSHIAFVYNIMLFLILLLSSPVKHPVRDLGSLLTGSLKQSNAFIQTTPSEWLDRRTSRIAFLPCWTKFRSLRNKGSVIHRVGEVFAPIIRNET